MKRFALLCVLLLNIGCAATTAQIHAGMDPWIGQDVSVMIGRWGAPSSTYQLPNNQGAVYTWIYQTQGSTVVTYYPYLHQAVATPVSGPYCRFDWTAGADGRIVTYRWDGGCRVIQPR